MVNVFIVEDYKELRNYYEKAFQILGHNIIASAKNGVDAVEMFKELHQKPDLILMDYKMPLKNGLDTTKEILEIDNNSKVFFVTSQEDIKKKVEDVGAIGFELKPINLEKISEIIKKVSEPN